MIILILLLSLLIALLYAVMRLYNEVERQDEEIEGLLRRIRTLKRCNAMYWGALQQTFQPYEELVDNRGTFTYTVSRN